MVFPDEFAGDALDYFGGDSVVGECHGRNGQIVDQEGDQLFFLDDAVEAQQLKHCVGPDA